MSGPAAVITGASRGLGLAIAERLARDGMRLFLCSQSDAASELAAGIPGASGRRVDVGDHDAMAAWGEEIAASGAEVRALVHNAAPHRIGSASEMSEADLDLLLRTQLVGPLALTNRLVPSMPRGSAVVFVGSALAKRVNPHMAAVSVAKHGVVALTRALAGPLARRGIRVNAVCPATCRTEYLAFAAEATGTSAGALEAEISATQLLGLIEPDEVAALVHRLLGDASSKVTGWAHYLDGGSLDGL